jgi:very-short-patch-repair endonuclease
MIPPTGVGYGPKRHWTDMELLRNEFGKEKRFVPVRDLMRRAGAAVQTLKPCFMMSPLSLAKFLPAGSFQFDLVVIDEASQMRPEDALGGLLRAKQLVVVGDQKQLPPTDFFARSGEGGASVTDEEDFEDLDDESILEACQKTFRETRMLRWHYRSRCESLIGFSNQEFYKNELITFPMAKPGSFSVDLIRVNGHNEARRNPAEAQTIAEEAIQFMRHYAEHDIETIPTLGIVAVNSDQRDLIFEEIRRMEADDALVEIYREKVAERGEPVFVKNLENVQGDERDFILISMTYGPKPGGSVVPQRFGPINGKQGHRRLNVLFSRARVRIGLFTSFGSVDVKPSETSSEGVHVLKRYLEYAENRGRAVGRSLGPEADSDFETEVADRLRLRGYEVHYQVGVSGFRIDLGIRHPDHLERYLAGVECDGARYHSSKSARDRDRLREEVLRSLGWDLVRVWSTDWFDNPDLQTERLIKQLEELRVLPAAAHSDYQFTGSSPDAEPDPEPAAGKPPGRCPLGGRRSGHPTRGRTRGTGCGRRWQSGDARSSSGAAGGIAARRHRRSQRVRSRAGPARVPGHCHRRRDDTVGATPIHSPRGDDRDVYRAAHHGSRGVVQHGAAVPAPRHEPGRESAVHRADLRLGDPPGNQVAAKGQTPGVRAHATAHRRAAAPGIALRRRLASPGDHRYRAAGDWSPAVKRPRDLRDGQCGGLRHRPQPGPLLGARVPAGVVQDGFARGGDRGADLCRPARNAHRTGSRVPAERREHRGDSAAGNRPQVSEERG